MLEPGTGLSLCCMMLSPEGHLGFAETPKCEKISYLKESANNLNCWMPLPKGCKWQLHQDALLHSSGLFCTDHLRQ